jgi:hypothetical protein
VLIYVNLVYSVKTEKLDDIGAELLKRQQGQLKALNLEGALGELQAKAKTCILAEMHVATYRGLVGEISLADACSELETIAKNKLLPVIPTVEKKVLTL